MKVELPVAIILVLASCSAGLAASTPAAPDQAARCEVCHGPGGDSKISGTPRLNGQRQDYLLLRLKEFADPTRSTPHATYQMWETATSLGDRVARDITQYFSSQKPTAAAPSGALSAVGEKLYRQGGPEIPACQQCHGAAGEGSGLAPRLAGQHAAYIEQQLSAFMLGVRVSQPMNKHAWHMSPDQFKALSAFLARD
jgi:cytochrome c553